MLKDLIRLALPLVVLFVSCKKDKDPEPEVPEVPETSIILTKYKKSLFLPFTGYYEGLPGNYATNTKAYPILIYIHGLGQKGDGDSQLDFVGYDGLGKSLVEKKIPPSFNVNGKNYSFIYICPQYAQVPDADHVRQLIDTLKKKYRVDQSRIYLSGLSVGGVVVTEAAGKYPNIFAAISPMAGTTYSGLPGNFAAKCNAVASSNLPVWAFHNEFDPTIPRAQTEEFVGKVNSYTPPILAKYTMYPGQYGHNAWTKALDTATRENGKNVYEWMLGYKR